MFDSLVLRGGEGAIVWSYHTAAVCKTWAVTKGNGGTWALSATVTRADPWKLRQTGLRFTAPRKGGFLTFPVLAVALVDASHVSATLGLPEG